MKELRVENASIETNMLLAKFKPRPYQEVVIDAIENKGYKKVLLNFHRRAGKDVVAFNIMIRSALTKVGLYLYCLPTYNQGRPKSSVGWNTFIG